MNPSRRQRVDEENKSAAAASKKNSAAAAAGGGQGEKSEEGGYTVVIRGLTTDLAAIYRDAIPRFLLPRVALQSDFSSNSGAAPQERAGSVSSQQSNSNNKHASLTTPMMRPLNDVRVAFRVETLSAYVTVPEDEARKAVRANAAAMTDDTAAADSDEPKKKSKTSLTKTPSENLAALCHGREIFGGKCCVAAAQSNHDQSSLVSVTCTASKSVTIAALTSVLKPVFPGFVSVIPAHLNTSQQQQQQQQQHDGGDGVRSSKSLRSKRYRLVFANERGAFEAKKLLDEFPASEDLRVAVVLNDQATRRYHEFVRQAENLQAGDE